MSLDNVFRRKNPDKKSSKRKYLLLLLLIPILIIILFLIGYYIGIYTNNNITSKPKVVKQSRNIPEFKLKTASPDNTKKKTKNISSEGGTITIVTESGAKISATIPQNAVEEETEISLTPLSGSPIEDHEVGDEDVGVILTPVGIEFKRPIVLLFDLDPQDDIVVESPKISAEIENAQVDIPQAEEELTIEERRRRNSSQRTSVNENSGVIFTDSSESSAGTNIHLTPTYKDAERSQVQTTTDSGGTYTFDYEITSEDAQRYVESVLNDPFSSFEQILEAAIISQGWGFEGLGEQAFNGLESKIEDLIDALKNRCKEGNGGAGRGYIQKWQGIAQELGFSEIEQELEKLLETCKGYYSFLLRRDYKNFDLNFQASVCGYQDDLWTGTHFGTFHSGITGSVQSEPFTLSLPPGGIGYASPIVATITGCTTGCYTFEETYEAIPFYFDGIDTVSISALNMETKIQYMKVCLESIE